jgi:hypothetical protein
LLILDFLSLFGVKHQKSSSSIINLHPLRNRLEKLAKGLLFYLFPGMSLEAGNQRKSPVTLAVTAGYFFSLKKIMRENLVSAIQRTVHVSTLFARRGHSVFDKSAPV